ncbi:MAG: NADH-ubiquinone oxidoreductase-F iron-sulfur binding region domain-containing protein [Ktedonobacterales bacterium]
MSKTQPGLLRKPDEPALLQLSAYRSQGGYLALEKAVAKMSADEVLAEVRQARLRGRGGAGVMAAEKLALVGRSPEDPKYVVCNAYDADLRSGISKTLLTQNPHLVIEGMVIAGYTVGASEGFLYVRGADRSLASSLQMALQEASAAGVLGPSVLASPFAFSITLVGVDLGFIGGEESTLIQIIKGRPAKAQQRPPYPTQYGIAEKPTLIQNVETLANLPQIVYGGGEIYSKIGTSSSPGTKLFTVIASQLSAPSVVEVPFGSTIAATLHAAGVTATPENARAVVVGGLEGSALPLSQLQTALDFETIEDIGAIIGSSIIEVLPKDTCMVHWAAMQSLALSQETCGKCVPCRVGVKRIAGTLQGIVSGIGNQGDLDLLEEFSRYVPDGSLCGFGVNAVNPIVSAMKNFGADFQAHIDGHCPTNTCQPMRSHRYVTKHVL